MNIGLKQGAQGGAVERLHRVLAASGATIEPGEITRRQFGASTFAALRALQARRGIRESGEIDVATFQILLELEQNITININEGGTPNPPPKPPSADGSVHGTLVDQDGAAVPGARVSLFAKQLRSESQLGDATTGDSGAYAIKYRRPAALNLVVRAYDSSGVVVAESATMFGAPADLEVDLTTAKDGVVRSPSRFTVLAQQVTAQLQGTPLSDLKENKETHEIQFLASAIGAPFASVADLFMAHVLGAKNALRDETLFGLFFEGIPATLSAALTSLPDAGIDDTFRGQVLTGVLAQSRATLSAALDKAVAENILPASYAGTRDLELSRLDDLRLQAVGSAPYVRGKTALSDLLAAGPASSAAQSAFVQAYADNIGQLAATWKSLQANPSLTKADRSALSMTLSAADLLGGNLPLIKDSLQRVAQGTLAAVPALALLDQNDWVARITSVDPGAASIPPVLPDETPEQRIARFAKTLVKRFASRYPTTAFVGGLTKAQTTSFTTKTELVSLLSANPKLNLLKHNVDQYVATNKLPVSPAALTELKTAQRLLRVSPHYTSVEALKAAGYASAQSIYFKGRAAFLAQMTGPLGSASIASMAYARAQMTYATALATYAKFNLALNGVTVAAMQAPVPDAGTIANMPNLQSLFGSLDYFECDDCQSVYSPAAYLVDLLQYLAKIGASGASSNARDALLARRPEIQNIALDCTNTNTTLPYIDLVNEILEAAIAPPSAPPGGPPTSLPVIETTGTSAERRALPQSVSAAVYATTGTATVGTATFPLSLPFDLPFARTTAYLAALGTSRTAVLSLFAGAPAGPTAADVGAGALDLNPTMASLVSIDEFNRAAGTPWKRWGFDSASPTVVDPKTDHPFTAAWTDALARVPVLLNRTGLTLQQLYQLLEVHWVTGGSVALLVGMEPGTTVLSPDTELMTFSGLTGEVLDRANRFLRLWKGSGLQMWELDWALESPAATGSSFTDFFAFLSGATAVQNKLNLPFQEVLSFWLPLETRDVTNHLGDEDSVVPSTYYEVFANPTMLQSWSDVFGAPSSLSKAPILGAVDLRPLNAITAALGLSADDIANILSATGASNTLSLETLNVLLRYARLASVLSLAISDLLVWIPLLGATPFGGEPSDTIEFLRRLAVLQGTGVGPRDLDYLLTGQSASGSALAFTNTQAATVLQAIRDAVAKLPAASVTSPISAATQTAIQAIVVQALAAGISASPGVVETLLSNLQPSLFPLPETMVAALLATPTVDPIPSGLLPLVAAFTSAARGAALFAVLGPTPTELAFVVQNASTFAWLNPAALPTAPVSPYTAFESLLRALHLNRRQTARNPKLFDVLGEWASLASLPDVPTAIAGSSTLLSLAAAINASVADVTALATKLGATAPSLGAAMTGTSLANVNVLAALASALDVAGKYSISGAVLVSLAAVPAGSDTAAAAMGAFQAQYPQNGWFNAVQPVEDQLRVSRRDALVAYLLGQNVPSLPPFVTVDDIFDYFLIDPKMSPCGVTTRLLQASLAIQQFVQQCFLNLTFQSTVDMTDRAWREWSWRQQFRLWQANREVFLYPENYVLPELRKNASPFFTDLENDVRQSDMDADAAEAAFENYLRKLVEVSRLVVAAHYNQINPDGSQVLHVFARTSGTPPKWFYRTRSGATPGSGTWTAWQQLKLDIAADHLVPVIWDRRLHILWPTFKPQSEPQGDQKMDLTASPVTSSPPKRHWVVELSMSELSAGEWQPKRTLTQKLFFEGSESPLAYTFRAAEQSDASLKIDVYWSGELMIYGWPPGVSTALRIVPEDPGHGHPEFRTMLVATCSLPTHDAPLAVVENNSQDAWTTTTPQHVFFPDASAIDTSQDPTYTLINGAALNGNLWTPQSYGFSGQDLVWGSYVLQGYPGTEPLYVFSKTLAKGGPANVELLSQILNPRVVIPQQEGTFDSLDPFFVTDPTRTYLVEPHFYTSSSIEVTNLTYVPQWTTKFVFESFYHPYARTFLRELEIGGVGQLMSRNLQRYPESVRGLPVFDFSATYGPQPPVAQPYPDEHTLDFDPGSGGAYSLYNWEIFYHAPMFIASILMQRHAFQAAMAWLEFIFNPTDATPGIIAPQRFWETLPFFDANQGGNSTWVSQQIQKLLQGISPNDPALQVYLDDPFDPHAIASLRPVAYAKATVMKFLDNLIAWGDSLYAQYTAETVNQAEQLYILADMILGPRPQGLRLPRTNLPTDQIPTYAKLGQLDAFSNVMVDVENLVVAPTPPPSLVAGTGAGPALPGFASTSGSTLLFCVPPNAQLLAYWDTVATRLSNIRNCLNIHGVPQPLPLYAPPINPLLLAEGAAGGNSVAPTTLAAPTYRFATYLQKSVEFTNDVRAYGSQILAALEKKDNEALAALRAGQELDIQTQMLDVKNAQLDEANDQVAALKAQKAVVQVRYDFYSKIAFMNEWETQAMKLQANALSTNGLALSLDMTAGQMHLMPSFQFGASGVGGSPHATIVWGSENIASSVASFAAVARGQGGQMSQQGSMVGTLGGYHRRADEWALQASLAKAELAQLDAQITAAGDRVNAATAEVQVQKKQIANAQAISDFLTNKYTSADLYDWMVTQLTTVYTQAYQLAFGLAQQAQNAYQYELGSQETFIQFGYWDSQHKGLTAGDSLLFDLRRMEAAYVNENVRELELTKHISLALTDPMALVQLRETGTCTIYLDEPLFERDNPGQYFRRLRSVAMTLPCMVGPYTGVNAVLSLGNAWVRTSAPTASYKPMTRDLMTSSSPSLPASVVGSPQPATQTIVTSSGQNDAGLFEVNLHDDRWLPFEGQGAISRFTLQLDPRDNAFDFSTLTDVVLHVRYTARGAGDVTAANIVRSALKPLGTRSILVSVAGTFNDAYYAFFNPADTTATTQTLDLPISNAVFPFSNLGSVRIQDVGVCFVLTTAAVGPMPWTFNPSSAGSPVTQLKPLSSSPPWPTSDTPGDVLYATSNTFSPALAPQPLTLGISAVPSNLATSTGRLDPTKVQDILLLIDYSVA